MKEFHQKQIMAMRRKAINEHGRGLGFLSGLSWDSFVLPEYILAFQTLLDINVLTGILTVGSS